MELSSFDKDEGIWNIVTRRSATSETDKDTIMTVGDKNVVLLPHLGWGSIQI